MARVLQQGVFFFNLGMFFLFGRLLCVWKTLDLKKKKKKKNVSHVPQVRSIIQ